MSEIRVHPSWEKVGGIPLAIMKGEHDDLLETIRDACNKRMKSRFRKGDRMKLKGTRNVELDGKECQIIKVNQKSVTVGVGQLTREPWGDSYDGGEFNVPPSMLEPIV